LQGTLLRTTLPPFDLALLRSDANRSAGDGLVLARFEIAQYQYVARLELDNVAGPDIVHKFDTGGRAFDFLDQRGGNERRRRAGECRLGHGKRDGGQDGRTESVVRHPTISRHSSPPAFLARGGEDGIHCRTPLHAAACGRR
jgi:hypothetical protein